MMANNITQQHMVQVNMKHDANGCSQCDKVAYSYITALQLIKQNDPIPCNNDLFEFVWQITNLILSHRESHTYHYLPWFDPVTSELWDLAKLLKEQSLECDLPFNMKQRGSFSSFISSSGTEDDDYEEVRNDEEDYRRAIRITIYNCRALVCEQLKDTQKALLYYRKCASVRPTPFEPQQHLQYAAVKALTRLSSTAPLIDSNSSVSSDSSALTSCTNCGIEKSYMPVCSRCKSQPYCSISCMKSHYSLHSQTCKKP